MVFINAGIGWNFYILNVLCQITFPSCTVSDMIWINDYMGGGDINDNNFLLNITVDIKVVLFSLTHAVLILT